MLVTMQKVTALKSACHYTDKYNLPVQLSSINYTLNTNPCPEELATGAWCELTQGVKMSLCT
jgi:hypothetical protein